MSKSKILRKGRGRQSNELVEFYREEEFLLDNSPLPTPEDLKRYQDIDPKIVDLFMDSWQREQQERHRLAQESVDLLKNKHKRQYRQTVWGMLFAFLSLMLFVGLTAFALYLNSPIIATIMAAFSVGTVITAFVRAGRANNEAND